MVFDNARKSCQGRKDFRAAAGREMAGIRSDKVITLSTAATSEDVSSFRCGEPGKSCVSLGSKSLLEFRLNRRQVERHELTDCHSRAEEHEGQRDALVTRCHR